MQTINVGLIGFGTVGSGLAEVLHAQANNLYKKTNLQIVLKRVADIMIDRLPEQFAAVRFSKDANDIFSDPEIDIVVELIGGIEPAKTFILKAITSGKHVVTANKALLSNHGLEIFQAAFENNVEIGFEASVGGGIPVIKALKEGLAANNILSIMGIMNGTANYILSQMTNHGRSFDSVLKVAQEKGYAEADPTYDIEGIDTAHKLAIIMTMAYGMKIKLNDISTEGISNIEPIDIDYAKEFGYRIKLLAVSRNHGSHVEARVHPTMVPEDHMLASINGAYNGIYFTGDMVGNVLFYGKGAGKMPTGSAVAADIVDIARNISRGAVNRVPALGYQHDHLIAPSITPLEKIRSAYYLRIAAMDKPGVLSKIAGILAQHGISIETVIQKGRQKKEAVPIVLWIYEAEETAVNQALAEIDNSGISVGKTVKIRILETADE